MSRTKVIIVGAGLAGLTTANELQKLGISFQVLEARGRIGGRTYTVNTEHVEEPVDLGGQWIGPGQDEMYKLVKQLGLGLVDQDSEGKKIIDFDKKLRNYTGTIPKLGPHILLDLQWAIKKLDQLMAKIDLDAPQFSHGAKRWDAMTVESWKLDNVRFSDTRKMFDVMVNAVFAADPADLSMLHFLFYLKSGGGLEKLIETKGGAQESRIVGGAQQLAQGLFEKVSEDVELNAPVLRVEQSSKGISVFTPLGTFEADRLVMTIPPFLLNKIGFEPELTPLRQQMIQRFPMGSVIKCVALYHEPFWKEKGFCGEAISDKGPVQFMFDDTPKKEIPGALVGFIAGNQARKWGRVDMQARKRVVLQQFARYFGEQALKPIDYIDQDWSAEEYSAGCYAGYFPPNALTEFGELLRKPEGLIHWAGTETATNWNGYMEGAVRSGQRVTRELAAIYH
ncbi:MAG: flavin monoamine oxidase family protein [Cyclobacteriaceae bacterium]